MPTKVHKNTEMKKYLENLFEIYLIIIFRSQLDEEIIYIWRYLRYNKLNGKKKKNSVLDNTTDTVETQNGNWNDTATPENAVFPATKIINNYLEIRGNRKFIGWNNR